MNLVSIRAASYGAASLAIGLENYFADAAGINDTERDRR